ncbi:MAG: TRAP transporter small permease [Pseudaminobacter sp.]
MANAFRWVTGRAETALLLIASLALFALMLLTFLDVSLRSFLNASIQPATELTRILMAITVFSALPTLMGRGDAIAIDLLDPLFRRLRIDRLQRGLVDIFCGVLLFWPARRLWALVGRAYDHGEVTEFLQVPQHLVLGFIAAAVAVTGLVTVARGLRGCSSLLSRGAE